MGQGESMPPEQRFDMLDKLSEGLFTSDDWQGIEIDSSLLNYSGLNSNDVLYSYRDQVFDVPRAVDRIGGALAGLTKVPNAVGLGALIISMILETVGKKTKGPAEMLQRVFADEKGNEVRDLMGEYLKRLQINLVNPLLQLAETRQIERDLSAQLTRLKNSMMEDGHMDARLLKQWVNGAAFHTQMLIHQARLEEADGSRVVRAAGIYQRELNVIMDRFKNYLKENTSIEECMDWDFIVHCCVMFRKGFFDGASDIHFIKQYSDCVTRTELVLTMFKKQQISWTKSYFSDLAANIPTLVRQHATFQIRSRY